MKYTDCMKREFFFFFFGPPSYMQDLNYLTRDQICVPYSRSAEF